MGQVFKNLLLPVVVVGDGERLQLVHGQPAIAVNLNQLGADSAEAKPLLHHMRGLTEPGRDFLRAPSAIFRKLAEAFKFIGGMQVLAVDVLIKADLCRVVRGVDNAADRLGLLDLLALDAQKLRQPAAFSDADQIEAGWLPLRVRFRLHHKVLQHPLGGDARRFPLDRRLAMRGLAGILRVLLELVERDENRFAMFGNGRDLCIGRHGLFPHWSGLERSAALQPWPSPRPGGARRKGGRAEGDHPACTSGSKS